MRSYNSSAGTCYEGACAGDRVYSTHGTCGPDHGLRLCAGKWGNCCNLDGACGTGDDFCGTGDNFCSTSDNFCGTSVCFSGNCTIRDFEPTPPEWMRGNTPDGTCGGENGYTCNVVYGWCCNKDGTCGVRASDY